MTLRKNFTTGQYSPISGRSSDPNAKSLAFTNYQSNLSEVYLGHPNRISRYNQYELMDTDAEVNACLDIIAEFSTQLDDSTDTPFSIKYKQEPTEHEVQIITKQLQHWVSINKFNQRMFKIFRNTLKYGDQIFLRDPETFELYWVDPVKLKKIIVNETQGKIPEQYIIEDISPNFQSLVAAQRPNQDVTPGTSATTMQQQYQFGTSGASDMSGSGRRYTLGTAEGCMPADHILHISLSEGLDKFYPFGQSILESIFKVFKQKELLEDAILIYRIQRAPERRVFKVFTGNMPANLAMSYVERIKNEVHQKRIPTANGGSGSVDATYNPLSINEDYFFPVGPDGHGSSVEMLPGGQNLGEIDDLRYFNNRLARGLRVPSSYLPTGPEESQTTVNDGRVGTAMIQEMRFNNYCKRLQRYVVERFDHEFKMFLSWRGLNIDSSLFDLSLTEPQNFATYRQTELYNARLPIFQAMVQLPYISKRFALEEFLGMTKEQIQRNSVQWEEEQEQDPVKSTPGDLRSVGVSTSDIGADAEMAETDMSDLPDDLAADDMGDTGATAESPDATPELGGGEENATT